ncbi:MAG TPA: hypothetical protein VEY33_03370 [Gemmatimonadota bacterium]|nr:hypothetical protein [Gemmatimonadota bacterium]
MFMFALGMMIGLSLGLVVIGFLALGSYDRGRDAESQHRHHFTQVA